MDGVVSALAVEHWWTARRGRQRAVVHGLVLAGLLFAVYLFVVVAPRAGTLGFDAYAYWAVDLADPYRRTAGALAAFTYSPVVARLFALAGGLSFWQFLWLWEALLVATLIWLGGRRWPAVLAFPPVALELYHGNIHLLIAAAIAIGFRHPASWAFVLLTKVTPGIGLLWFLVRGEWRALGLALLATSGLVAISVAIDGQLWLDWISRSLLPTATGAPLNQFSLAIPLLPRLVAACALVTWGARTDRTWTVPVAATLALPVLWPSGLAVLAALWRVGR
jgi:hypothetical protein